MIRRPLYTVNPLAQGACNLDNELEIAQHRQYRTRPSRLETTAIPVLGF